MLVLGVHSVNLPFMGSDWNLEPPLGTVKFEQLSRMNPPALKKTKGMDPGWPNERDPTPCNAQVATQQNSRRSSPSRFRGANPIIEDRKIVGGQCGHFQHHMTSYLILFYDWLVAIYSICWEGHHPNWQSHIFQRGGSTTNQYDVLTIEMREICPLRSGPCSHWCHRLWIATKWHRVQDTRWKNVARTWELPWNYRGWVLLVGIWGHNYGEIYPITTGTVTPNATYQGICFSRKDQGRR